MIGKKNNNCANVQVEKEIDNLRQYIACALLDPLIKKLSFLLEISIVEEGLN